MHRKPGKFCLFNNTDAFSFMGGLIVRPSLNKRRCETFNTPASHALEQCWLYNFIFWPIYDCHVISNTTGFVEGGFNCRVLQPRVSSDHTFYSLSFVLFLSVSRYTSGFLPSPLSRVVYKCVYNWKSWMDNKSVHTYRFIAQSRPWKKIII